MAHLAARLFFFIGLLAASAAFAGAPADPVSARQTATLFLQALAKGDLAKARGSCMSGEEFAALSKHRPDPKEYDKKVGGFLESLAEDLSRAMDFKGATVVDVLVLPESEKNRELVLAVVHAQFAQKNGKPMESPLVLSFVKVGGEWKFLMR